MAAALMIARGQVDHGLQIMRAVDDRYDGRLRDDPSIARGGCATGEGTGNPFGDDHRSFFSAGDGSGTLTQRRRGAGQVDRLAVRYGAVTVRTLRIAASGGDAAVDVDGRRVAVDSVARDGATTVITLTQPVTVRAGEALTARS